MISDPTYTEDLSAIQAVIDDPAHEGNPLRPLAQSLIETVRKLERRLDKISSITDRYQTQLMETRDRLTAAASTDLLTGLANRRAVTERMEMEIERSRRPGHGIAVLIADIDRFKLVNDTYGHMVGDRVLQRVADTIRGSVRPTDLCARWGGEEFLIILSAIDPNSVVATAERLRRSIEDLVFEEDGKTFSVTMSLGAAGYACGESLDQILIRADQMLYQAKAEGRNRVCAADGD